MSLKIKWIDYDPRLPSNIPAFHYGNTDLYHKKISRNDFFNEELKQSTNKILDVDTISLIQRPLTPIPKPYLVSVDNNKVVSQNQSNQGPLHSGLNNPYDEPIVW